jgi:hypothetical protein
MIVPDLLSIVIYQDLKHIASLITDKLNVKSSSFRSPTSLISRGSGYSVEKLPATDL